jgi:hypothetical protein
MKIAGAFTHMRSTDFHWVEVKEKDFVPESANLLHTKLANPLKQGEQLAEKLRKTKRRELQSKTRGTLYGNVTPRERSVSPMFTGLQVRKFPA